MENWNGLAGVAVVGVVVVDLDGGGGGGLRADLVAGLTTTGAGTATGSGCLTGNCLIGSGVGGVGIGCTSLVLTATGVLDDFIFGSDLVLVLSATCLVGLILWNTSNFLILFS